MQGFFFALMQAKLGQLFAEFEFAVMKRQCNWSLTSVLVHRRPAIFFSKKYRAAWALAYCQVWFRCGRKSLSHLINADSLRYTLNWKVQSAVSLLSNIQERDKNKKWELIHYRYFAYPLFPFYCNFILFFSIHVVIYTF